MPQISQTPWDKVSFKHEEQTPSVCSVLERGTLFSRKEEKNIRQYKAVIAEPNRVKVGLESMIVLIRL